MRTIARYSLMFFSLKLKIATSGNMGPCGSPSRSPALAQATYTLTLSSCSLLPTPKLQLICRSSHENDSAAMSERHPCSKGWRDILAGKGRRDLVIDDHMDRRAVQKIAFQGSCIFVRLKTDEHNHRSDRSLGNYQR